MASTDTATVVCGPERFTNTSLVGRTVGAIREDYTDLLNIPSSASASIDGASVSDSSVVEAGQVLVFSRTTGQKG